jgi:hypothetical protein
VVGCRRGEIGADRSLTDISPQAGVSKELAGKFDLREILFSFMGARSFFGSQFL